MQIDNRRSKTLKKAARKGKETKKKQVKAASKQKAKAKKDNPVRKAIMESRQSGVVDVSR